MPLTFHAAYYPGSQMGKVPGGPYIGLTNFRDFSTPESDFNGDKTHLFDVGDVLSPYSNPPFGKWSDTASHQYDSTKLSASVDDFIPGNAAHYVVSFRRTDSTQYFPPSKPQGLRYDTTAQSNFPRLQWIPNLEPDITQSAPYNGWYEVQRSVNGGSWINLGTVSHPTTEFEDNFATLGDGVHVIQYRVRAWDNSSLSSSFSQPLTVHIAQGALTESNAPHEYTERQLIFPTAADFQIGMTFRDFVELRFCPGATVSVEDTLSVMDVETDKFSTFLIESGGVFLMRHQAHLNNLKQIVAENGGKIVVGDSSVVRMYPQGQIAVFNSSILNANVENWARFESSWSSHDSLLSKTI